MAFGVTAEAVAQFAKKPFIQQALAKPFAPKSVLSYFTGVNYFDCGDEEKEVLRKGTFLKEMSEYWYAGGEAYDELCQPFGGAVQKLSSSACRDDPLWQSTVEGKVAQLILADQLSRNCFRGTDQAFAFDDIALGTARDLVSSQEIISTDDNDFQKISLEGEFYDPYWTFVITSLMHSEAPKDHEVCVQVLQHAKKVNPEQKGWWEYQEVFESDHKKVIDEFGRYPHRNKKKGRENTPEEDKWLADTENLPGWALSQL